MNKPPLAAQVQKLRRTLRSERMKTVVLLESIRAQHAHAQAIAKTDSAIAEINASIRKSHRWDWPGARYGMPKQGASA